MSVRQAVLLDNPFLIAPIGRLFLSNALPMAVVMSMGGILTVVDGIFVGRFIGSEALTAVSLTFPVIMILSALATLIGGGMSSLMARHLGAGDRTAAARAFTAAHGLVLATSVLLVALWLGIGPSTIAAIAAGNDRIAAMAQGYLTILIFGAPLQLALGVHADALRNEGRAGLIAAVAVAVNLFNIAANWLGIVVLDLGISGSALGTVAAQALGLMLVIGVRIRAQGLLPLCTLLRESWGAGWGRILVLGLPLCLSFFGIAFVASVTMLALHQHAETYDTMVAAYGGVTRFLSFAFLPQMAMALALLSIAGNNAGAGRHDRALAALRLAMAAAFLWCLAVTLTGVFAGQTVGGWFSTDPQVIAAFAHILRPMMAFYTVSGPVLVLALYFQAIGQPQRTAVLTLIRPWLLTPALVFLLSAGLGARGIWLAFPAADLIILFLAFWIGRDLLRPGATANMEGAA